MKAGRTVRDIPPPLELECLRALWELGEANVHAVRDVLCEKKPLAYTTIMTMLDRLTRKQLVARRKVGRSFLYSPLVTREAVRQKAVAELVQALFDGSPAHLLSWLQRANGRAVEFEPLASEQRLDAALL